MSIGAITANRLFYAEGLERSNHPWAKDKTNGQSGYRGIYRPESYVAKDIEP